MSDDMKLPSPWTCRDCVHFRRCTGLIGISGDERLCDWAPSRFRLDTIGSLARLVESAGLVMTLYGQPVSAEDLRSFVNQSVSDRITNAIEQSRERAK